MLFLSPHHLEEVTEIGNRVTVLRDGEYVDRVPASTDHSEFVRLMVGRDIEDQFPRRKPELGDVLLEVKKPLPGRECWKTSHLSYMPGKWSGSPALSGLGRTELAEAIFGSEPADSGEVQIGGESLRPGQPREAKKPGNRFYY